MSKHVTSFFPAKCQEWATSNEYWLRKEFGVTDTIQRQQEVTDILTSSPKKKKKTVW